MDIVERLNRIAGSNARNINPPAVGSRREDYLEGQAADEIEKLRVENDAIRKELQALRRLKWPSGAGR